MNSNFESEFIPKKIDSHLTNLIVYDLETHNTERAKPYVFCFYRLSKLAGKYSKEKLTPYELEKCEKATIVIDGDECVTNALDFCLKLKGEERKVKNKIVEDNLQLHAHNGSGFDTWVILINLACDKHIGNTLKNGKCIIEVKVTNEYIEKKTNSPISSFPLWYDSFKL